MIMPLLFAVYILFLAFTIRTNTEEQECGLSKDSSVAVRGAAAIRVFLIHVVGFFPYISNIETYNKTPFLFWNSGYFAVATFFFLSGYGMQKKIDANFDFKSLINRCLSVGFPFLIANLVYIIVFFATKTATLSQLVLMIKGGITIVDYSWYIVVQLGLYVFMYFASKLKKHSLEILMISACTFIYIFVAWKYELPDVWYHSIGAFLVGIIWAEYSKSIMALLMKPSFLFYFYLLGILLLSLIFVYFYSKSENAVEPSAAFFVCFLSLFLYKFKIKSRLFSIIGTFSLEFYLYQGIVLRIIKTVFNRLNIYNVYLYVVISFLFLAGISFIISAFDKRIITLITIKQKKITQSANNI